MFDVKITVMCQHVYKELMEQYENPMEHACDMMMGEVYISRQAQCPKGFCRSAWMNVGPFVKRLAKGECNFYDGWMKNPYSAMISCNDGFRPVSFYLETITKDE